MLADQAFWTLAAEFAVIFLCLAGGGLLKGATGAGAPVLAVPALVMFFDVTTAIVIFLLPNLVTNAWQGWRYRAHIPRGLFLKIFLIGGVVGVALGTWALTQLSGQVLEIGVGVVVLIYVLFRLLRPHWQLREPAGTLLSLPAGIISGILQGASGISAPVSITYLNAMRLGRSAFIPAISSLFLLFVVVQLPALWLAGLLSPRLLLISGLALLPILLAMPVGARLAQRFSPEVFDRVILVLLAGLAAKLLYGALA